MFGRQKPEVDPKTEVDYAQVGRAVESALVRDYVYYLGSTKRQIWSAFVRGVFTGLGTVVGVTIVLSILLSLLNAAGGAPLIGKYIKGVAQELQRQQ